MKKSLGIFIILSIVLSISSCKVFYPNQMFKQNDYQYFELAKKEIEQYTIEPGDQFTISVYSRDGFRLVDVVSQGGTESYKNASVENVTFLVDAEGFANLPILGNYYIKGFSEMELERILEEKYSSLFVDPYVVVKVSNRRAFVFVGQTGSVIALNEAPTSLIEVLAKAGGLGLNLKAYKIKLIRGSSKNPEVRIIDLSTIEGMRNADLTVRSNDIIYVEERRRVTTDVLREVTPIVSLITTLITFSILIGRVGN